MHALCLALVLQMATGYGGGAPCAGDSCAEAEGEDAGLLQVAKRRAPGRQRAPRASDEKLERQWAMLQVLTNYDPQGIGLNHNFSYARYQAKMEEVLCEGAYLHHNLVGDWGPRDVFIEYGAISDYSINGHYRILGAEILNDTIHWEGDVVRYDVRYYSAYDILGVPRKFHTVTKELVTFANTTDTDPGCILEVNATDGEPMKSFSQLGAPETPESTCRTIAHNCGEEYFPFEGQGPCKSFYSELPWQCASGFGKGNSWVCRNLHVYTSSVAPSIHCNHTAANSGPPGPGGPWEGGYHGGYCRDEDCEGSRYCRDMFCLVRGNCRQDPHSYLMACDWEWLLWWQNVPDALQTIGSVVYQILFG